MNPKVLIHRMAGFIVGLLVVAFVMSLGLVVVQWEGFAYILIPTMLILLVLSVYTMWFAMRYSKGHIKYETDVEQDRTRLLALVNSLGEAVFAVDKKGRVLVYNAAALELIDSHKDIYNEAIDEVLALVNARNEPESSIRQVFEHGKVVMRDDLVLKTGVGETAVYLTITPIKEAGELTGAIILARDISKQRNLEGQKDEFLSVVSHELRTPVAVVEADLSTVLLPGFAKIPPKAEKLLRSASQNLTYLSGLLQDISDLSHSERAVLDTEIVSFSAQKMAKELADDLTNQANKAGLKINLNVAEQPILLSSSYQRLKEILMNFMTNAIKYSSGHGHVITISVEPSKKFPNGAKIIVTDEGIGISPTDLRKLFKKFFRSADKKVQEIKGTGMGLYITTKQADKIGAVISVSSKINHGSSFCLDVPAKFDPKKVISTNSS